MSRRKGRSPLRRAAGGSRIARPAARPAAPGHPMLQPVLQLQQAAGNRATEQLIRSGLDEEAAPAASSETAPAASPLADSAPAAPPTAPQAAAAGLIVEDDTADAGGGQMRKSEFLDRLETRVCAGAQEALAGTGRTTEGCPWIEHWFEHYRGQDAAHVERALRRYAPEAAGVTTVEGYVPIVVARVKASVEVWARTGEVTGVPADVPMPGAGILGIFGGLFASPGGAPTPAAGEDAEGSPVQRRSRPGGAGHAATAGRLDPAAVAARLGPGAALDGSLRARMESAFGQSLSHVRVHADRAAAGLSDQLSARAFAVGPHVAFGAGEFQPGTPLGDGLIAHELAHVVQQGEGPQTAAAAESEAGTRELESAADSAAAGAVLGLWGRGGRERSAAGSRRAAGGLRLQRCASTPKRVASPKPTAGAASDLAPRFAAGADVDPATWRQGIVEGKKLDEDAGAQALGALLQQELGKAATVHIATQTHPNEVHPDDYQEYPAINFDINLSKKTKWESPTKVGENPGYTFTAKGKAYSVLGANALDEDMPGKARMYADHESFHARDTDSAAGKATRDAEIDLDRKIRKEKDPGKLSDLEKQKDTVEADKELRLWTDTFVAYFDQLSTGGLRWSQLATYDQKAADPARSSSLAKLAAYHDDPPVAEGRKAEVRKKLRLWLHKQLKSYPTTQLYQQLAARIKLGQPPQP